MKRKMSLIVLVILLTIILSGCPGPDGNSYQKYWWAGSLGYIYDTNPSTPNTIYNDEYFSTNAGDFYMEYEAFDGSEWYLYYRITINEGGSFMSPGSDIWFEIGLYSTGPTLYQWDSARNLELNKNAGNNQVIENENVKNINIPQSNGRTKSRILGKSDRIYPYGTIKIEFGRILP